MLWHYRYTAPGTERPVRHREAYRLLSQTLRLARFGALAVSTIEAPGGCIHVRVGNGREVQTYAFGGRRSNWSARLLSQAARSASDV
jgi:hypothetical protein